MVPYSLVPWALPSRPYVQISFCQWCQHITVREHSEIMHLKIIYFNCKKYSLGFQIITSFKGFAFDFTRGSTLDPTGGKVIRLPSKPFPAFAMVYSKLRKSISNFCNKDTPTNFNLTPYNPPRCANFRTNNQKCYPRSSRLLGWLLTFLASSWF